MKTLHQAASTDDVDALRKLLRHVTEEAETMMATGPIDIDAREDGVTALMLAVGQSANEAIRMLVAAGADVDVENCGSTPLVYACSQGFAETASILLQAGAYVDSVDQDGWTPLMHASFCGWETVLHLLLDYRANVDMRNSVGQTSLDLAAEARQPVSTVVLRDYGARIEDTQLYAEGREEEIRWISETARLFYSAINGDAETLRELLTDNADAARLCDEMGQSLLTLAAQNGRYHVVELLLEFGAQIDAESMSGRTALMDAVEAGYINTARLLIRRGADPGRRSNADWSALTLAASREDLEMVRMIIEETDKFVSPCLDYDSALLWTDRTDRPDIAAVIDGGRQRHAKAA